MMQEFLNWFAADQNAWVLIGACLSAAFLGGAYAGAIIPSQSRILDTPEGTDDDYGAAGVNIMWGYMAAIVAVASIVGAFFFSAVLALVKAGLIPVK